MSDSELRSAIIVSNGALTYICAPPGSGQRIGIDRDLDGILDGDESGVAGAPVLLRSAR